MENIIISKKISTSNVKLDTSAVNRLNVTTACHTAWCVRATLDPDTADVSRPHSQFTWPLVRRRWLGVFRALNSQLCLQ